MFWDVICGSMGWFWLSLLLSRLFLWNLIVYILFLSSFSNYRWLLVNYSRLSLSSR